MDRIVFSSKTDEWETPQDFFDKINELMHFTLDPCSTDENCKCQKHYTIKDNGLEQDWSGEIVWCNPPYSDLKNWTRKCWEEAQKGVKICLLIPARTDTRWFHTYCFNPMTEVVPIQGRLKFSGSKYNAPFPNLLICYNC